MYIPVDGSQTNLTFRCFLTVFVQTSIFCEKRGSLKKNYGRGFLIGQQICEATTFFEKVSGYSQAFKVCEKCGSIC